MRPDYSKLIFWLIGVLSVIMTSIAGSSASRVLNQLDAVDARMGRLEMQVSGIDSTKDSNERRLQRIEDKLDSVRIKQDWQSR